MFGNSFAIQVGGAVKTEPMRCQVIRVFGSLDGDAEAGGETVEVVVGLDDSRVVYGARRMSEGWAFPID